MARRNDAEAPIPQLDDRVAELPPLANAAAELAQSVNDSDTGAAGEPEKPIRRRRRRKAKPETEQATAPVDDASPEEKNFAQALSLGFDFGGRIVAGMRGDHWQFKPEETEMLGNVWAKALHPYMGQLAPYTPFIVATIVSAGVMMPRVQTDRLIRAGAITPIQRMPVVGPVPVAVAPAATEVQPPAADNGNPELQPPPAQGDAIGGRRRRGGTRAEEFPPGVS